MSSDVLSRTIALDGLISLMQIPCLVCYVFVCTSCRFEKLSSPEGGCKGACEVPFALYHPKCVVRCWFLVPPLPPSAEICEDLRGNSLPISGFRFSHISALPQSLLLNIPSHPNFRFQVFQYFIPSPSGSSISPSSRRSTPTDT